MESSTTKEPVAKRPAARAKRSPRVDAVLADAVEQARSGLLEAVDAEQVGEHVGVKAEADRVLTHYFVAAVPGYAGWHWYSVVARAPRSKKTTVSEIGLLPTEHAVQAPPWVPWSQRVRPEDTPAAAEAAGIKPTPEADAPEADAPEADAPKD